MSEQNRSRLYAWFCEQTDEPLAEYLMSCLPPTPVSDLVTKDFLRSELAVHSAAGRAEFAAQRTADREELIGRLDRLEEWRDTDRREADERREANRREAHERREADRHEAAGWREADRHEYARWREADRHEYARWREADRREAAEWRAADAETAQRRSRWTVAIGMGLAVEILAANMGPIPVVF